MSNLVMILSLKADHRDILKWSRQMTAAFAAGDRELGEEKLFQLRDSLWSHFEAEDQYLYGRFPYAHSGERSDVVNKLVSDCRRDMPSITQSVLEVFGRYDAADPTDFLEAWEAASVDLALRMEAEEANLFRLYMELADEYEEAPRW